MSNNSGASHWKIKSTQHLVFVRTMKLNYETCLIGSKCVLVPYRRVHVDRYHKWMQSPALLEATGSEPLSLTEEYEMQESWKQDEKKCTFIILERKTLVKSIPDSGERDDTFVTDNVNAMVGDVNLFLSEEDDDNDEAEVAKDGANMGTDDVQTTPRVQAELDIMVAEESARGRGIGLEATCLMMLYGAQELGIRRFFCKINQDNESSLYLFRKLNFVQCDYVACFQQYEYELKRETAEQLVEECLAPFIEATTIKKFSCPSDVVESRCG